jgi:hypothetical protein
MTPVSTSSIGATAPTDDEISAHAAFGRVVGAARLNNLVFWIGLPLFAAIGVYGTIEHHEWAIVLAGLLAVANVAGQMYGFHSAREPLLEISEDNRVRARAWRLASIAARPRLLRRGPGA